MKAYNANKVNTSRQAEVSESEAFWACFDLKLEC